VLDDDSVLMCEDCQPPVTNGPSYDGSLTAEAVLEAIEKVGPIKPPEYEALACGEELYDKLSDLATEPPMAPLFGLRVLKWPYLPRNLVAKLRRDDGPFNGGFEIVGWFVLSDEPADVPFDMFGGEGGFSGP